MKDRLPRKLAAILYADVAGYSRLTGADEDATHRRLTESLDLVSGRIDAHRGRVMHYAGDAVLAMFDAVVDAVECAAGIQTRLGERNQELPSERRIDFRIGINLGDVIEDRGDIYSDGVNVAARSESLAEPGGICISESVHTAVGTKLPFDYEFMGEQTVKNIAKPVKAYHARVKPGAVLPEPGKVPKRGNRTYVAAAAAVVLIAAIGVGISKFASVQSPAEYSPFGGDAIDLPDRPSIAVLAFDNLSNDPDQNYLGAGLAEDLITSLSYLRGLLVIARHSAFGYKDKPIDVTQIGQELGVRHVLEGSVRKIGDQLRITVQLVDTATRDHTWAKRFDVSSDELFSVQDTIVEDIVTALNVELVEGEQARGWNRSGTDPEAYDLFLRARELLLLLTEDAVHRSIELAERAIAIDPTFAMGWVQRGWGRENLAIGGWSKDLSASWEQGIADAQRARALDPRLADAHTLLGSIYTAQGKYDKGIKALEKGVELGPNNVQSIAILSVWLNTVNRSEEALTLIKKAWRLNPFPPDNYFEFSGWAYHGVGQNESAALAFDECARRLPDYIWCLLGSIASHMAVGQGEQAQTQVEALINADPDFSLRAFADMFAESDLVLLQNAGVPK